MKRLAAMLLASCGVTSFALAASDSSVQFARDVAPIFEQQCSQCHGEKQQLSELRVDSRDALLKGGIHGPAIIPGDASKSRLYRHVAGIETPTMPMGKTLAKEQIEFLKQWIDDGARWDDAADSADKKTWWSFVPPQRVEPETMAASPIDGFLLDALQAKGLKAAPPADKRTLIRRAYLDLTGLMPPPEAVDKFVADDSLDAFAKLVDELLESPRYGERWGRHWLDVVRYADSSGYEMDYDYPNAWRYRDYVIESFNDDKPYDRFVQEQLAGDEVDNPSHATLIATGMHRIGPRVLFREKDNPQYRYSYLDDMIATTSRAFLGMTVDCARCHDHKFDPIEQMDYYRMMAVFYPHVRYDFPLVGADEVKRHEEATAKVEARTEPLTDRIAAIEKPYKEKLRAEKLATFPVDIQEAVATPEAERTEGQKLLAAQVERLGVDGLKEAISAGDTKLIATLEADIAEFEKELPEPLPVAMGIRDGDYRFAPNGLGDEVQPGKGHREDFGDATGTWLPAKNYTPPPAYFLPSGDWRGKGDRVEPGYIKTVARGQEFVPAAPTDERISSGRRLALAKWITSEENPLTARVMVNRIWMHHFGHGLVTTASNFGRMGTLPSHPELLDWLALEFVKADWSIKSMHRLIMNSDGYKMVSAHDDKAAREIDPDNALLWHYPQHRLEGEAIRDVILQSAGKLNFQTGGPGFFPPIPQEVRDSFLKGRWDMNEPGPDVWRRSVYVYGKRGLRYPMFEVFDQPSMNVTNERRTTTTVATQALTLLNNDFTLRHARHFAERVAEAATTADDQVAAAYRIALSRQPTARELSVNKKFLEQQKKFHGGDTIAALTDVCDVILNLNEFVYLN